MRLNIADGYVPLEEFKAELQSTTNLQDVHFLCHQCGCPVYIARDINNACAIFWHPQIDRDKDVIKVNVIENVFTLTYKETLCEFGSIEELSRNMLSKHMLGDKPFDKNFCVWKREI